MDFGFEESYNAVVRLAVDHEEESTSISIGSITKDGMTDDRTAEELSEFKRLPRSLIKADSAEPKTIQYFQRQQGFNMVGAHKYQGSRLQYTKKIKRFKKDHLFRPMQRTPFLNSSR
jgi:phage terminase large subunit